MEDIKELVRSQQELTDTVRSIDEYLRGTKYGQKGVKDMLEGQDDRIKLLEEHRAKEGKRLLKAGAVGGAIGGSLGVLAPKAILAKVWAVISHLF